MTAPPFDEAELLEAIRAGEPSAGPVLVSMVAPGLLPYAERLAPDLSPTDRELLCEVVVESAVRKADSFDPRLGTFSAWVRGMLRLEIQAERRKRGQAPLPLRDDLVADTSTAGDAQDVSNTVVTAIRELVQRLSRPDQLILQLRNAEDMSYQDISALLGVEEAACRQRHRRACRRLAALAADDPAIQEFMNRRRGTNA